MNKKTFLILGIIIVILALLVGYQLFMSRKATDAGGQTTQQAVHSKDFGISFTYPMGNDGFTLIEPNGGDKGMLKAYLMLPTTEYDSYKNGDDSDAPAGMNVFVFALQDATATSSETDTRISELQNWAADNNTLTQFKQAKNTPDVVELDGIKGLHYQAQGLYQQDVYLVSYKSRVYMMVGQYDKQTDHTYTAFQDLIKTVSFE